MADTKVMTHVLRRRSAAAPAARLAENLLDLSSPEGVRTQLIELSPAARLHTELLEICARDLPLPDLSPRASASDTVVTAFEADIDTGDTVVTRFDDPTLVSLADTEVTRAAPARPKSDPNLTIYDGGALREFARQLAEEEERQARAALTRKAHPALERGPSDAAPELPAHTKLTAPPESFTALHELVPPKLGTAVAGKWRRSSRSRKLILLLLPLAGPALFVQHRSLVAHEQAAPRAPASLSSSAASARVPSAVVSARPAPTEPEAAASAPPKAEDPTPPPNVGASADPRLEREALRAAFAGNKQQALAAYERLAKEPQGERFRVAARLLREDRVQRP